MKAKICLGTVITLALLLGVYHVIFAINPTSRPHLLAEPLSFFSETKSESLSDTLTKPEVFKLSNASVVLPIRSGFPFCETFIGFDPRPNAIWDGTLGDGSHNPNVKLTGNSLQLTSAGVSENGYVFVDIPFSSAFGLKVSFEFSSWGGTGADGFSFFMFDGLVDPSTFEIGGTGGALGYTPVRDRFDETKLIRPGLKGAYLGIGFDELGNFGNSFNGKNGGMEDPLDGPDTPNRPLFKHSVVVRGPSDGNPAVPLRDRDRQNAWKSGTPGSGPRWDSYKFIDGRIFDPLQTPIILTPGPVDVSEFLHTEKLELDTDTFADACPDEGFRKVFIDLNPIDINDRSKGYTVEIQMLVNVGGAVKLINVFDGPIDFKFAAPELLKVGFAASTGQDVNFHEIRNVTVQVSNEDELEKPLVGPLTEDVCQGETNTFELDVELRNDVNNAFIRCIQLYYSEKEAEDVLTASGTTIPFPPSGDVNNLCPTGNCVDLLCLPERTKRIAYDSSDPSIEAGEFEVFLEEVGGEEVSKVRFIANPGFSGQTSIYFTVTDNFGQVSDPELITINVNPQPQPVITTLDPLVWEQQEADKIRVLLNSSVTDPAYDYQWARNGNPIPGANGITYLATQPGEYSVSVVLPQGCTGESEEPIIIRLVGDLEPDFENAPSPETCAQLGAIQVELNNLSVSGVSSDGSPGNEKWKIITAAGAVVQDWTFLNPGETEISFEGLTAGDYILQLGDEYRSGQPGSDGSPLFRHEMPFTILPIQVPLQIESVTSSPELCFGQGGEIIVKASGGDGPASYTFNLINGAGASIAPTSVSAGQATFSSLPQGDYEVEVSSSTRCVLTDEATITGPSSTLDLVLLDSVGISCGVSDSGTIQWEASGGTPPYTFVSLKKDGVLVASPVYTLTGGTFDFTKLVDGEYSLTVKDAKGCSLASSSVELAIQPAPKFEVKDVLVCEGEPAVLQPEIVELSNSEPVFNWKNHDGVSINADIVLGGVNYTFTDDGNPLTPPALSVAGLSSGTYDFTLSISGPHTCSQEDKKVKIAINPFPIIDKVEKFDASCYQQQDGRIEVILDPSLKPTDFSFELFGVSGPQDSNVFDNLAAGSYEIKVINKLSSCGAVSETVVIGEPDQLKISVLDFQDPSCNEDNGAFTFTVSGGSPDYSILIDGKPLSDFTYVETGDNYEVEKMAPGSYVIEVSDSNSCNALVASPVVLSNQALAPISVSINESKTCEGDKAVLIPSVNTPGAFTMTWFHDQAATQEIKTSATPDSNGLTYSIDPATGTLEVSGLSVGDYGYYLVVAGSNLCPRPAYPAKIEVYEPLHSTLVISDELCFGAEDGSIEVNATGADGKYEFSLNGGAFTSNPIFKNLAPGDYSVNVRSQSGCTISNTAVVTGASDPISTNIPDQIRSSCGQGNGRFENLLISGGWGSYTVKWTLNSLSGPVVNGDIKGAYDLFPGEYFLSVTDAKGCTEVFQFDLEASSDPEYNLVPSLDVCEGETVEIRPVHLQPSQSAPPAAFTEVRWYKQDNQQGLIQNGPDSANPAVSYTIDDSDWLSPRLLVKGLQTGIHRYYFYVVCTGVEHSTDVEIFPIPEIEFDASPETCLDAADGRINVSKGGNSNTRYSIDGGPEITEATLESQLFKPGKYSIIASQQGVGCPSAPVEVEILKPASALAVDRIITRDPGCGASNGVIEGVISGGWKEYQINLLAGSSIVANLTSADGKFAFQGLDSGNFKIEVTDQQGCKTTSELVVLVPGPTRVDVEDIQICEGDFAEIVPELEPSTPGATISWYFDSAKSRPIVSSSVPAADGITYQIDSKGVLKVTGLKFSDGPKTYYSDVSGPDVCPGFTASSTVTANQPPALGVSVDAVACFGEKGKITLSGSAGSGSYEFSLDGTNFQDSGVFDVDPGIYTGYVRSAGCTSSVANIDVSAPEAPLKGTSSSVTPPTCDDANGDLEFTISGGYGSSYGLTLVKDGAVFKNETVNGTRVHFGQLPVGSYQLTVSDNYCSISIGPIQLSGLATSVSANDDEICEGDVVELLPATAQSGINPLWSWFKDSNGTQPIFSGQSQEGVTYAIGANGALSVSGLPASTEPYRYYLGISGDNICPPALFEVKARVHSIANLKVSNPSIVCDPTQTVDLTQFIEGFNPSVFDYKIFSPNGSAMQLIDTERVSLTGDYRVSSAFKGLNCWNREQKIRVIVSDTELIPEFRYEADLGGGVIVDDADVQILEDIQFIDRSQGKILIWNWDFGDGYSSTEQNPSHQYEKVGTYTVKLTTIDEFGCVAEIQKLLVAKDDYLVIIPNAFTPDGAKNQYFVPQFRGIVGIEFYIFSTWGELLFKSTSMEIDGWDGTFNGKPAIPGNYVYRGTFTTKSGLKIEKAGTFILIR